MTAARLRRIGVASEDEATALLVAARLGLARFEPVLGPLALQRQCLREGTVDEVLVLGSGDDAVGGPGLTVWHPDAEAGRTGESLVAQLQSLWKTDAEPPHSWESGPVDVPVAAIVAALGRLQPDLKLILATPLGQLGVCTVGGRVVSAGLEGQAMLRDAAVTGDASLKLVLDLWGESQTHLAPQAQLHGELGLVCEYAELFAASAGFVDHLERVLATTLSLRVSAIHAESHAPSSFGVSALELLKRGLGRLPAPARGALIPAGVLRAPLGLPRWLRATLAPQRFGRLFFALEEGATLGDAIAMSRLDPTEAETAVALATLTGAVVLRKSPPAEAAPRSGSKARPHTTPLPAPAKPIPGMPPDPTIDRRLVKIAPETEARLAARDGQRASEPTPVLAPPLFISEPTSLPMRDLDPRTCGAPARFFDIMRHAAEESRRAGRHRRLAGTRFEPVGEKLDDILLYFRIGSGGTGDVFLGVQGGHGGFQKTVALKRLVDAHLGEDRKRAGFLDEARVAASLEHPNIAHIFRLIESEGRHQLIMEFVHGVSVAQLAAGLKAAREPAPEAVVRWIGAEAARGLHYMHQRRTDDGEMLGLVHRDVAPPNILIGFDGSVKLIDLSIAQVNLERSDAAHKGVFSGRLGYSAPEVLAGFEVGPASDLFGLAATLYELLIGEPCFIRGTPHTTIDAVAKGEFNPILKARPDVSPRLAYAIERGLSHLPRSRFKSLAAFREALLREGTETDPAGCMEALLETHFGDLRVRERDAIERMRRSAAGLFVSAAVESPPTRALRGGH